MFNRQRLTYGVSSTVKPTPLVDEAKTLGSYGVPDGATLRMKDLGRQVGYKYLYLWEYVSLKSTHSYSEGSDG